LREVVRRLPLDRILVETDSPYLAPVPHRGKRNEPAFVRVVAETVAQVKGIALEEVAEATSRNAQELFAI
jgi:TatD DNase family protein